MSESVADIVNRTSEIGCFGIEYHDYFLAKIGRFLPLVMRCSCDFKNHYSDSLALQAVALFTIIPDAESKSITSRLSSNISHREANPRQESESLVASSYSLQNFIIASPRVSPSSREIINS